MGKAACLATGKVAKEEKKGATTPGMPSEEAAEDAYNIIREGVEKFSQWLANSTMRQVIALFSQTIREALTTELQKSLKNGPIESLVDSHGKKFVDATTNKLSAQISKALQNSSETISADQLLESLVALFDLNNAAEDETIQQNQESPNHVR